MLCDLLEIKKGVTAVIGGGGKTTLLHTLAKELVKNFTVIITTTTHIYKSDEFMNVPQSGKLSLQNLKELVDKHRCICLGKPCMSSKFTESDFSFEDLCSVADYVLVEADGSKGLPLKAHLDHEPVIPTESTQVISVVGVDCVGEKLSGVTHRANRACEILMCGIDDILSEEMVAQVLNDEDFHDKVLINKCDTTEKKTTAEILGGYIKTKCVISSLLKGEWYVSSN